VGDGSACSDGDDCTAGDACENGVCVAGRDPGCAGGSGGSGGGANGGAAAGGSAEANAAGTPSEPVNSAGTPGDPEPGQAGTAALPDAAAARESSGCGCQVPGAPTPSGQMALLAAGALAVVLRRRRDAA
jgi:MYXO-CTERM domain-containing protein